MAALTQASWTVTVIDRWVEGRKRYTRGTMALAGTDTYPTGGVPAPDKSKFGFVRELNEIRLFGQPAATTQYLTVFDRTNQKVQLYEEEAAAAGGPLLEADTAEVPGPRTYDFIAIGW